MRRKQVLPLYINLKNISQNTVCGNLSVIFRIIIFICLMDKGLTIHNYYKLRPVNVLQGIIVSKVYTT